MRLSPILGLVTGWLAAGAGCSSSDDGPPLTNATSLDCPYPGDLPFRLPTSGFERPVNEMTVTTEHQTKDQAFDVFGQLDGVRATAGLADDASPAAGPPAFDGVKARTTPNAGLTADAVPGEHVSLWYRDDVMWQQLGTATTGEGGDYHIAAPAGFVANNGAPIYTMLDADGSCAVHRNFYYPAGYKVVVTDIDGTLTTDDGQILTQATNESYVPAMMTAANTMTKAWNDLGYPVIYLTARPHVLQPESRSWLTSQGFAEGPVITEGGSKAADAYKTLWLNRIKHDLGWNIVAAYGNADTDITAYDNAGIPHDATFIIGPLAGTRGTVPIADMSYTAHIQSYVSQQPMQSLTLP